jgi:hypothetical protein
MVLGDRDLKYYLHFDLDNPDYSFFRIEKGDEFIINPYEHVLLTTEEYKSKYQGQKGVTLARW